MRIFAIWMFAITCVPCFGQTIVLDEITNPKWEVQVYFDFGIPIGQFGDNMSSVGTGVGAEGLYKVQGPVKVGLGLHSFRYDKNKITYDEQFDDEVVEIKELTATRTITLHAIFRFQPELNSIFSPYVQGGIGWHWFYTNTKIKDLDNDEMIDQFNELRDSELGLALHAGVQISPESLQALNIDVRVGYFKNGPVTYLSYNAELERPPGAYPIEFFEARESVVQFLGIQVGLMVRF